MINSFNYTKCENDQRGENLTTACKHKRALRKLHLDFSSDLVMGSGRITISCSCSFKTQMRILQESSEIIYLLKM